jgi:hypothetical protein
LTDEERLKRFFINFSSKVDSSGYNILVLLELDDDELLASNNPIDLLLFIERIVNMKDKILITQYREILEQEKEKGNAMYIPLIMRDSADELMQRGREEVVKGMLAEGVPLDVVVRGSGLSQDAVKALMS